MNEIITDFENAFKQTIQPYLEKRRFKQFQKDINSSIGSYNLVFSADFNNTSKYISFEFSLHHYDLRDGIFVFLYTEKEANLGYGRLNLNEISKNKTDIRKNYSTLVLETTMPTILFDLQQISNFFIEKTDLLKYQKLFYHIKSKKNDTP